MNEGVDLPETLSRLVAAARAHRQRRVLALAGDLELGDALHALGLREVAWVGGASEVKARSLLGAEVDAVVLDLRERFDAEALGAVHGAIRAGGLLIVRTPDGGWDGRLGRRAARLLESLRVDEPVRLGPPQETHGTE